MKERIPESQWRWFGVAGHFICGRWCRFHLATWIGDYLVSTVGEYVHPRHGMGSEKTESEWLQEHWPGEDVGHGRKYETMVFKAGEPCMDPQCKCGLPAIDGSELTGKGYNSRAQAQMGHNVMCDLVAKGELEE